MFGSGIQSMQLINFYKNDMKVPIIILLDNNGTLIITSYPEFCYLAEYPDPVNQFQMIELKRSFLLVTLQKN
jgi:hypothetical protein